MVRVPYCTNMPRKPLKGRDMGQEEELACKGVAPSGSSGAAAGSEGHAGSEVTIQPATKTLFPCIGLFCASKMLTGPGVGSVGLYRK